MPVSSSPLKQFFSICACFVFVVCTLLTFDYLFSLKSIAEYGWQVDNGIILFKQILLSPMNLMLSVVGCLYIYLLYKNKDILFKKDTRFYLLNRQDIIILCVSLLGALAAFLSSAGQQVNSVGFLFNSNLKACITILGIIFLTFFIFSIIKIVFHRLSIAIDKNKEVPVIDTWYWQQYITLAIILIVCWIPYALILSPGTVYWDGAFQLEQAEGYIPLDTHHPILSTFVLDVLYNLGRVFGNDNFGILMIVFGQLIGFSCACTYEIYLLNKLKAHKVFVYFAIVFFALYPVFGVVTQIVMKDTLFAAFFTIYITLYIKFIIEQKENLSSFENISDIKIIIKPLILLFVFGALSSLFRYNAFIVVSISLIVLLFISKNIKARIAILLYSILSILLIFSVSTSLEAITNAKSSKWDRIAESISLPAEQIGRYWFYADEGLETWEEEAITNFFDMDRVETMYLNWISDGIKGNIRGKITDEDFSNLVKAYFSLGMKSPLTYLDAFVLLTDRWWCFSDTSINDLGDFYQNHALLERFSITSSLAKSIINQWNDDTTEEALDQIQNFEWDDINSYQNRFDLHVILEDIIYAIPLLGLFMQPAMYTWTLILVFAWFLYNRKYRWSICLLPCALLLGTVILGPVNGLIRYDLALYMAFPLIIYLAYYVKAKTSSNLDSNSLISLEQHTGKEKK